jgi:hypothetical protein
VTGYDATQQALCLLGYTAAEGAADHRQNVEFARRALPVLNALLADILPLTGGEYAPLATLADPLPITDTLAMRLLVPGVAMHFAAGEGDGDNFNRCSQEYTARRSAVRRPARRILDVMP